MTNGYLILTLYPIPTLVCRLGVILGALAMYILGWRGRPLYRQPKMKKNPWLPTYKAKHFGLCVMAMLWTVYCSLRG